MMPSGFFWHVHHDILLEWLDDIDERIAYIREHKPVEERELRLRLLKPVRGRVPDAVVNAHRESVRANSRQTEWQVNDTLDRVRRAYWAAGWAYASVLNRHRAELEALHHQECPDCPWDGKTIFPR